MDEVIRSPYDLIEITVDNTPITARPIKWNAEIVDAEGHTSSGELAKPAEYETMCPHCAQMLHFAADLVAVKCTECGRGEDLRPVPPEVINPFEDPGEYVPLAPVNEKKEVDLSELLGEEVKP